jgi:hypothetical protein
MREGLVLDVMAAWSHYQQTGLHLSGDEADAWLKALEENGTSTPPACHT